MRYAKCVQKVANEGKPNSHYNCNLVKKSWNKGEITEELNVQHPLKCRYMRRQCCGSGKLINIDILIFV